MCWQDTSPKRISVAWPSVGCNTSMPVCTVHVLPVVVISDRCDDCVRFADGISIRGLPSISHPIDLGHSLGFRLSRINAVKCPVCKSCQLFRSQKGNAKIHWVLRPFLVSVRCYQCSTRFSSRGSLLLGPHIPKPPVRHDEVPVQG